jgi:hypothetical protein
MALRKSIDAVDNEHVLKRGCKPGLPLASAPAVV